MNDEIWLIANQRFLTLALEDLRQKLERVIIDGDKAAKAEPQQQEETNPSLEQARAAMPGPSSLELIGVAFDLTDFERDLLLLCAGIELSSAFAPLCADAHGDARKTYPTFALALSALPHAHWSALQPSSPLRRFRLIDVERGEGLMRAPLRIDEWILHSLTGAPCLDERLQTFASALYAPAEILPSQRKLAESIVKIGEGPQSHAAILLCGADRATRRELAAAAASLAKMQAYVMRAAQVPLTTVEQETLALLWQRENMLARTALVIEIDDDETPEATRAAMLLAERATLPVFLSAAAPVRPGARPSLRIDVKKPARDEQAELWSELLGASGATLTHELDRVLAQFNLGRDAIRAASAYALSQPEAQNGDPSPTLWNACRAQARPRLDDLAQRIQPAATWENLILPEQQLMILRDVATHVKYRGRVYDTWGFGQGSRGLGVSALFAGASGTGKTMAAEVLASALEMDLYRIDLSQVVSKYIGETEKNLRRVFDAAEEGAAILLFDEADALFGKRSEVKDSHDRYANIEVSYLLQRMESYRGLAILTTNMKEALDSAFLRRLRFVIQFPFPDAEHRRAIWQRIFPKSTPTEGIDFQKLARLDVAGGNIRNIALNAAFLAAENEEPVRMNHVLRAAQREYAKLQRPLTEVTMGGIS